MTPILLLRDPELIKQICVKDFEAFPEHQNDIPEDVDPLWAKNLFASKSMNYMHLYVLAFAF